MADEQLVNFPSKTDPDGADIVYVGDMSDGGNEVQSTIGQIIDSNNIVTTLGSITAGNIPVLGGTQNVKDSGIPVDVNQNITNVKSITLTQDPTSALQAATKQYADTKLAKASNLSDLTSAASGRSNLGLGNAAVKTVTDNGQSNVASVSGAFTTNHVLVAADSSGTVKDGGATSQFLIAANNLSDVASDITSFDNISPNTTKGDLITSDGTNNVRLAVGTDGYFLQSDSSQTKGVKWAPIPSGVTRVITGATVLTATDYGTTIILRGSSNYTVTLPSAALGTNATIDFTCQTTSNAIVTIQPAAGLLQTQTSVKVGKGDGLEIISDGTDFWIPFYSLFPVSLYAYASVQQSISSTVKTKITFNTTYFDIGSSLNTSTNTVLPKWPGKYEITFPFSLAAIDVSKTSCNINPQIEMNGSVVAQSFYTGYSGQIFNGGPVIYNDVFNGTSDSLIFYITVQNFPAGGTELVNNDPTYTNIQLKRVSLF